MNVDENIEYRIKLHERLEQTMVRPKFATPPDFTRPSLGRRQTRFADIWMRRKFMPHQEFMADLYGELELDEERGVWVPAHSLTLGTIQRQAGKTDYSFASNGERCTSVDNFRSWYTSQTGSDASDQLLKFAGEVVKKTPLDAVTRTLRGAGREVMEFTQTGSTIRPYAPTKTGLHGKQSDGNDVDEAWAFSADEGKALLQGSGPTELTRPAAQTRMWSAGGTAESTWLAEWVAKGRDGAPGLCYVEFGVPDDLAIEGELTDADFEAIAEHHPAIGHTITVRALKKLREKLTDDAEFARAAGNRWTEIIGGAISSAAWSRVHRGDPLPIGPAVGYGSARAVDGSHVAIAAAVDAGDHIAVEVLAIIPAYDAAPVVDELTTDGSLVVGPDGPSAPLHEALVKRGRALVPFGSREAGASVANLLDSLPHRRIRFRQHPALDDAVKVAGTRPSGDGGKQWARVAAGAPVAALEAATKAVWAVEHPLVVAPKSKPLIAF